MTKKISIIFVTLLLLTSLTLTSYAEHGEQGKLRWIIPPSGSYDGGPHAFDIQCLVDKVTGTTYDNAGYIVQFKSNFIQDEIKNVNIKPKSNDGECYITSSGAVVDSKPDGACMGVKVQLYFDSKSNDNNYIRVKYTVTNYTNNSVTYSLGTGADVKIGNNDQAEVKTLPSSVGFTMIEGNEENSLQYVFFGRDTDQFDVTDVDSIWIDKWTQGFYDQFLFSNKFQNVKGIDSAFAYSWNDRTIASNESQNYNVVFQIDYAKNVTLPGEVAKPVATPAGSYSNGDITITLNCNTVDASIYYTLDGSEPTSESSLYDKENPIVLSESATLKAIAIKAGSSNSKIMTEKYTIGGFELKGKVTDENLSPIAGAQLKLTRGTKTITGPITSGPDGTYRFEKVPGGKYNVIIEKQGRTFTKTIEIVDSDLEWNIVVPSGNKNTVIELSTGTPDIVVESLEKLFEDTSNFNPEDAQHIVSGGSVKFKMDISKTQPNAMDVATIAPSVGEGRSIALFLDINLNKILLNSAGVETSSLPITQVENDITLVIPVPEQLKGKGPFSIIRLHDNVAEVLADLDSDEDTITVKTKLFSIYAITILGQGSVESYEEDDSYLAWQKIKSEIESSSTDTTIKVDVYEDDLMPVSVMNALKEAKGTKLVLKYKDQEIIITPEAALTPELGRYAYPIQMLLDHYLKNISVVGNKNPSTGNHLGLSAIIMTGFLFAVLLKKKDN